MRKRNRQDHWGSISIHNPLRLNSKASFQFSLFTGVLSHPREDSTERRGTPHPFGSHVQPCRTGEMAWETCLCLRHGSSWWEAFRYGASARSTGGPGLRGITYVPAAYVQPDGRAFPIHAIVQANISSSVRGFPLAKTHNPHDGTSHSRLVLGSARMETRHTRAARVEADQGVPVRTKMSCSDRPP